MNDVQLRSFTAAVELGSFNKAAKGQFLSVPSFAQRINSLEAEPVSYTHLTLPTICSV